MNVDQICFQSSHVPAVGSTQGAAPSSAKPALRHIVFSGQRTTKYDSFLLKGLVLLRRGRTPLSYEARSSSN